jgi:hypothetical protein
MKTRGWLIFILVLAVLAVYSYLGFSYLRDNRQTHDRMTEISSLNAVLSMTSQIPTDIDQREAAAQAKLTAAQSLFAGETDYAVITGKVLRLAEKAGISAVPLSTRARAAENIADTTLNVFHLSLKATGKYQNLVDFFRLLETSDMETLTVQYLKVDRESVEVSANLTAELDIALYSLPPGK